MKAEIYFIGGFVIAMILNTIYIFILVKANEYSRLKRDLEV